jgi:hypothetical protein
MQARKGALCIEVIMQQRAIREKKTDLLPKTIAKALHYRRSIK